MTHINMRTVLGVVEVEEDKKELGISLTDQKIQSVSKEVFKTIIKNI
jgi:hypothetical protein